MASTGFWEVGEKEIKNVLHSFIVAFGEQVKEMEREVQETAIG